ncbi:MAG: 50S ribosomal protein L3 [Candidatus Saganbacteria bacterium]|nr:50S ribosomal protein L3 [Candidatus Saganbacteria bacterium]
MDGILGKKIGMTQVFDEAGNVVPVTVVEAGPCVITQIKTAAKEGYAAVQVGFGQVKELNKPMKGHLKEAKVRHLREFWVAKPEELKIGQEIKVDMFNPGDVVTISGTSIGKGFAGTIKRHHHHRGPMSHGSKSHRITGSIGAGTTPGRVFKGRGMAGHMGAAKVTQKNVRVVSIDAAKNLILLSGAVPGKSGNLISILRTAAAQPAAAKKEEKQAEQAK